MVPAHLIGLFITPPQPQIVSQRPKSRQGCVAGKHPPTLIRLRAPEGEQSKGQSAAGSAGATPTPRPGEARLPAGEAAGSGAFMPCYNFGRLSNQSLQVPRKRFEQALRVGVVGKERDDVTPFQRLQRLAHFFGELVERFELHRHRAVRVDPKRAVVADVEAERIELGFQLFDLFLRKRVAVEELLHIRWRIFRQLVDEISAHVLRLRVVSRDGRIDVGEQQLFELSLLLHVELARLLRLRIRCSFLNFWFFHVMGDVG